MLIKEAFEKQVERTPNNIAVRYKNINITYKELNNISNKIANLFIKFGFTPRNIVGIYLEKSLDYLIIILSILKAGLVYLPIDITLPSKRLNYILKNTSPFSIITSKTYKNNLPSDIQSVIYEFNYLMSSSITELAENPKNNNISSDIAYIIYTSGSTGTPKGVVIEHKGIFNLALSQSIIFEINEKSNVLQFYHFSFDASVSEWTTALIKGACLDIYPYKKEFSTEELISYCKERNITVATLPPSLISLIKEDQLPTLKTLVLAGEVSSDKEIKKWIKTKRVINAYGPTEATVCSTMNLCNEIPKATIIGKPIDKCKIFILDKNLQICKQGEPGEIGISGINLAREYLNNPILTSEKFITIKDSNQSIRLYRTGDLGSMLYDGNIKYLGRNDRQIKINGFRIELDEIELTLRKHFRVKQVGVIYRKRGSNIYIIEAYIVLNEGSLNFEKDITSSLLKFLFQRFHSYMIPSNFVYIKEMPLTINGKINYEALEKKTNLQSIFLECSSPEIMDSFIELQLKKIWQEILEKKDINRSDNFFSIGGTSLLVAYLIMKINNILGYELTINDIYHNPDLKSLLKVIKNKPSRNILPIIPIQLDGHDTPLILIHPAGGYCFSYLLLSKYINSRPLYGINDPYFGKRDKYFSSLEDMASCYANLINNELGFNKLLIGGWSFGGIVALETARILKEFYNKKIEMIILIDSFNISILDKKPAANIRAICRDSKIDPKSKLGQDFILELRRNESLLKNYTPKQIYDKVILFKSSLLEKGYKFIFQNQTNGWKDYISNLTIYKVPVSHRNFFDIKEVSKLGEKLNKIL